MGEKGMWSTDAGGGAGGLRAQLLLALLILALFPMVILNLPLPTHAVFLELGLKSGEGPGGFAPVTEQNVRTARAARRLPEGLIVEPDLWPSLTGPGHRLELTPANAILLDGRPVDRAGLRAALDRIALSDGGWVDIRPDPHSRTELFHEVLAVIASADFDRLRLDNRPFARALDEDPGSERADAP
jgi:hypothetical protein